MPKVRKINQKICEIPDIHAAAQRVRDEQPALSHLRLPPRFLHPHGDHGRHLRPHCPPPQASEAGVGNTVRGQTSGHQNQSPLSR